jgi:hypothetical protein
LALGGAVTFSVVPDFVKLIGTYRWFMSMACVTPDGRRSATLATSVASVPTLNVAP